MFFCEERGLSREQSQNIAAIGHRRRAGEKFFFTPSRCSTAAANVYMAVNIGLVNFPVAFTQEATCLA